MKETERAVLGIIELQGVKNARDLGGIPVGEGRMVAPGLLYRGGPLTGATVADRAMLFDQLGIRCVIDLRTGWEREAKPDIQEPGVENLHIPFFDLDIVGIEYTRPAAGTVPIERDVAYDPDHYYRSFLNDRTVAQMREAVNALFERAMRGCPVYFHCSGGKDRAGILALLALAALGASSDDILKDYLLTNESRDADIQPVYERFLAFADGDEALARELTRSHRARPENLSAFYDEMTARYGSMSAFIRIQLGIDSALQGKIRQTCSVAEQDYAQD